MIRGDSSIDLAVAFPSRATFRRGYMTLVVQVETSSIGSRSVEGQMSKS